MFEKLSGSSGNVVGYKAIGTITASDYLKMEPDVKALVEKEGNIRLLIDLSEFKWEKMEAWLQDLKFGSEFRHEIQKIAIVGDKTWEKWMTYLARPFYARDAKFFHIADIDKAWAWLRE
ncbi:MAG: STAS/SEC14 domain-containing protein [Methanothrix sp.]|nr:STAS/SEC14 domain-containing protein [Methanothrix sp.]